MEYEYGSFCTVLGLQYCNRLKKSCQPRKQSGGTEDDPEENGPERAGRNRLLERSEKMRWYLFN